MPPPASPYTRSVGQITGKHNVSDSIYSMGEDTKIFLKTKTAYFVALRSRRISTQRLRLRHTRTLPPEIRPSPDQRR